MAATLVNSPTWYEQSLFFYGSKGNPFFSKIVTYIIPQRLVKFKSQLATAGGDEGSGDNTSGEIRLVW